MNEHILDLICSPYFRGLREGGVRLDLPVVGKIIVDQNREVIQADLADDLDQAGYSGWHILDLAKEYIGEGWYIVKEVRRNADGAITEIRQIIAMADYATAKAVAECDEAHRDIWCGGKLVSW